MKVDLSTIEDVVLSHNHDDHTGRLPTLRHAPIAANPKGLFRLHVAGRFITHAKPEQLLPGISLTGAMPRHADELLYLQDFRSNDMKKLAAKETTIAQIALEHDVPAYVIENALDHQELCERHWTMIEKAA